MSTALKLLIALILPVAAAVAADRHSSHFTGAEILNCGEILRTQPVGFQDEPQTVHGYVQVMSPFEKPKFRPGCPEIEASLGDQFGVWVNPKGKRRFEEVTLVTRVTHPPIRHPATGETSTQDEWESPMLVGQPRYAGWVFDQPWELVPGSWTIEILHQDKTVARQDFQVQVKEESESDTAVASSHDK